MHQRRPRRAVVTLATLPCPAPPMPHSWSQLAVAVASPHPRGAAFSVAVANALHALPALQTAREPAVVGVLQAPRYGAPFASVEAHTIMHAYIRSNSVGPCMWLSDLRGFPFCVFRDYVRRCLPLPFRPRTHSRRDVKSASCTCGVGNGGINTRLSLTFDGHMLAAVRLHGHTFKCIVHVWIRPFMGLHDEMPDVGGGCSRRVSKQHSSVATGLTDRTADCAQETLRRRGASQHR